MPERLVQLIVDMEEEQARTLVDQMLEQGADPVGILEDCRAAMGVIGKRFESGDYFLPELMLAGEILKSISAQVKPHLEREAGAKLGARVLLGTVKGDIHDLGKDIVSFMLDANGFQVTDLGVDVPVETFVEKIKELQPPIVALSGFLTLAYTSMKETIEAIEAAGLRDTVKIMVGGGTIDEQVRRYVKADAFGKDAVAAVTLATKWTGVD